MQCIHHAAPKLCVNVQKRIDKNGSNLYNKMEMDSDMPDTANNVNNAMEMNDLNGGKDFADEDLNGDKVLVIDEDLDGGEVLVVDDDMHGDNGGDGMIAMRHYN